ncbi:MAG TPA: hypothetical protein VLT87_07405 [Thermoanaerobaculia bacterium]|nr:hypothetical protein [Thermoanaerobaculia bacterium]
MKKIAMALALGMAMAVSGAWAGEDAAKVDAKAAFETLKGLAGEWRPAAGDESGRVVYEVVSNGSVVMERQYPGTSQEMMTLYHMADGELVATHYCSAGNQPRMKLDLAKSKPGHLVFGFVGGTNFDPKKDAFVHDGWIAVKDADHVESEWVAYHEGGPKGVTHFSLSRIAATAKP